MAIKTVVVSGRGGVGKTAIVACLATALCRRGKRVLAVDADTGMRSLDIALGLESRVVFDSVDIFEGTAALDQSIIRDGERPGLSFLAAAQLRAKSDLSPDGFRAIIKQADAMFDYILIDAPTGIDVGFKTACACADRALIVSTDTFDSVRATQAMAGALAQNDIFDIGVVFNRVRPELIQSGVAEPVEKAAHSVDMPLLGIIAEAADIAEATQSGRPLSPRSGSGMAFDVIARGLMGEDVPQSYPETRPEFGQRLKNSIRALRGVNKWDETEE